MGPFDRIVEREKLLPYGGPGGTPAGGNRTDMAGVLNDDPLAAARGAVNGVLWGAILWTLILWAVL